MRLVFWYECGLTVGCGWGEQGAPRVVDAVLGCTRALQVIVLC